MRLRVMLTLNGRILREEAFEASEERDVTKSLNRVLRNAMKSTGPNDGETQEFRLAVTRWYR